MDDEILGEQTLQDFSLHQQNTVTDDVRQVFFEDAGGVPVRIYEGKKRYQPTSASR